MEGGVGWNGALVGANVPVPAGGLVPLFARSAALSSVLGASVGFTAGYAAVWGAQLCFPRLEKSQPHQKMQCSRPVLLLQSHCVQQKTKPKGNAVVMYI